MAETNPDYVALDKEMSGKNLDNSPIELLERIRRKGRTWKDLSAEYGVDNPDPPWRINLESTCDNLAYGHNGPLNICRPVDQREEPSNKKVDAVERRWEEDQLTNELYTDVPFPERQLLALAHTMIRRGLFGERELAVQLKKVSDRLNMVDGIYQEEQISNTETG